MYNNAPIVKSNNIGSQLHNNEIKYHLDPMSLEQTVPTGDNILIKIMPYGSQDNVLRTIRQYKKAAILI